LKTALIVVWLPPFEEDMPVRVSFKAELVN